MRGGIGRQLRSRAVIRRSTSISDEQGGWVQGYADLAMNQQCRRRAATDADITVAEQVQGRVEHLVYWLPDEDVRRDDHVVVDGYELKVLARLEPSERIYILTPCEEIQIGAGT